MRREERKAQTRQDLVEAAVTEFGRHGYQGGRVERIAAAAGVTTGALYAHFGSKEDLFLTVYEEAVHRLVDEAEVLTYHRGKGEPVDVAVASDAWLGWHTGDPRWIRLVAELMLSIADLPVLQPDIAGLRRQGRQKLAEWLSEAAESQGRRLTVPAEELALHLHALGIGMALEHMTDPSLAVEGRFGRWVEAMFMHCSEPDPARAAPDGHRADGDGHRPAPAPRAARPEAGADAGADAQPSP
ncbi:MAG TPA: TetR/AcrR family transcriptional regulator [Acidimicrobiales bacterium]